MTEKVKTKTQKGNKIKPKVTLGFTSVSKLVVASIFLLFVLLFQQGFITHTDAATGINHTINFQGKLVNPSGTNVTDGSYSVVFSIYSVSSGGSAIWTETQSVTTLNGVFQVNLGSVTTLPGSVDFNTDNIYLGVKVGADAEMTPRIQFTSVPQAFNSEKLGGLTASGFIQNQTAVSQTADFKISGTGTIGTSVTVPLLQSAAATALTITANAASTWSTSAGTLTIQGGSGTVSLGTSTSLTSTNGLTITGGTTLSVDSSGTNALSLGTSANDHTVTLGSTTGVSNTIIQAGSAGINLNAGTVGTNATTLNLVNTTATTINFGGAGTAITIGATTGTTTVRNNLVLNTGNYISLPGSGTRPGSPTAGMLYYDTSTNSFIQYNGTKWVSARDAHTKVIAASNASQTLKDAADVVLTGTADQTLINTALTAAAGGSVYLTEGTYNLTAAISVPNNTTLQGAGQGTLITIPNAQNGSYNMITNSDTSTGTHVTIRDLQIDGNKSNQTSGNMIGIFFSGMGGGSGATARDGGDLMNIVIRNIFGATSGTGVSLSSSNGNSLRNVTVVAAGTYGVNLTSSSYNTIVNSVVQGSNTYGISLTSSDTYNTLTGNTVNGTTYGIVTTTNSTQNTITGNTIQGAGSTGILIDTSSNTITGNNINGGSNGIGLNSGGNYNSVTGNTTSATTINGLQIFSSSYNIVSGNKFHDSGGATGNGAIAVISSSLNNTISGNDTTDTSCTSTCVWMSIDATSTGTYLSGNRHTGTAANPDTITDSAPNTIYANQTDNNGNLINRNQGGLSVGTTSVSKTLTLQGSLGISQLPSPAAPTLATGGTAGATTITYGVTALDGQGETLLSTTTNITTANATLGPSNFVTVSWNQVGGAVQYKVYRTATNGTSPVTTGLIGTVNGNVFSLNDTGLAGSGSVPAANTTGGGTIAGLLQTASLNVTGTAQLSALTTNGVVHTSAANGTLTVSAVLLGSEVSGTLPVGNGGTGVNGSSASNGQLLIGNGSGFTLGTISNGGGLTVTNGSGTISIAVNYGSSANQAAQGNTTITCPSASGNASLSGSGNAIAVGAGGTCNAISLSNTPSFNTITASTSGNAVIASASPQASATASLFQGGSALSGGSANGTVYGANITTTADLINLQVSNSSKFKVDNSGAVTATSFSGSGSGLTSLNGSNISSGTIAATVGGTGNTTYAVGDLLYASTTSALSRLADVASGSCLISGGTNTAPLWGACGTSNIVQVPSSTAQNTITPTATGVVGLTVNGTSGATSATALVVNQPYASADGQAINLTNTSGTQTNGLAIVRNGTGGTTSNLLNLTNTAGTVVNAIALSGTYTSYLSAPNLTISNSGSISTNGTLSVLGNTAVIGPTNQQITLNTGAGSHGIEIGRIDNTASTPFIDFHSGTTGANDYDARIITSGGNASAGNGTLTLQAATTNISGILQSGGTQRLDASGNLSNIGTISSGLINGQTISSTANFTGTLAVGGNTTVTGIIQAGASAGNLFIGRNIGGSINVATIDSQGNASFGTNSGNGLITTTGTVTASGGGVFVNGTNPALSLNSSSGQLAVATSGGSYSSSAVANDVVLRNTAASGNIILQQGAGAAQFYLQGSTGFIGLGTASPNYKLDVQGSSTAVSGANALTSTTLTVSPASAPGATTTYTGSFSAAQSSSANLNANTQLTGSYGYSQNTGSATLGVGNGVAGGVLNTSNGIISNALGIYGFVQNTGAGSITSARALQASSPTVSAGSIGTAVGVQIAAQLVSGVTTGYGIYQTGSSDLNYFAGNLGVGVTTPSAVLHVVQSAIGSQAGNGTTGGVVLSVTGAAGGATSGTTGQTAGNSGSIGISTGNGGAATGASGNNTAGNGGSITLQAGNGGVVTSATGAAGWGGNIFLQAGSAGTGGSSSGLNGGVVVNGNGTGQFAVNGAVAFGYGTAIHGSTYFDGVQLFKNTSNSVASFQIQNSTSGVLLNTDTTNMRVSVGSAGTATGQLYVSGTSPTAQTGSVATSSASWDIQIQNNVLYTLTSAGTKALEAFDVTNPSSPVLISSYPVPNSTNPNAIKISGHYVYEVDYSVAALRIIDVSNPKSMSLVSSVTTQVPNNGVVVSGSYVYLMGNDNNIYIYDISNPVAPIAKGSFATGLTFNMESNVYGKYMYSVGGTKLNITDISNPSSPSVVSTTTITGFAAPQGPIVVGKYLYAYEQSTSPKLYVIDISNPASPSLLSTTSLTAGSGSGLNNSQNLIQVEGKYAYVANEYANKIDIIDVSNPSSPVLQTPISTSAYPVGIVIKGRYLYAEIYTASTIQIFDIGGTYSQALQSGTLQTTDATIEDSLNVAGQTDLQGGVNIGRSLNVSGDITGYGNLTVHANADSATAFSLQNSSNGPVLQAGTLPTITNLISNPSLENPTIGWVAYGGATSATRTTAAAFVGNYGLSIVTPATANAGAKFPVTLAANTTYTFSFDGHSSNGTGSNIDFGYSSNGSTDTNCFTQYFTNANNYTYNCTFTTPGTVTSSYVFVKQHDATARTFYADSFLVTPGNPNNKYYSEGTTQLNGLITSRVIIQQPVDSTATFEINTANGSTVLDVDAAEFGVGIGGSNDTNNGHTLKVTGGANVTGKLLVGLGGTSASYNLDVRANQTGYAAQISNTSTATSAGAPASSADGLLINLGTANASRTTGNYFVGFAGGGTVAGKIQGGASAVAYTTTAADYAEYFTADELAMPTAGELVALDATGAYGVTKAKAGMPTAVGVVSTSPGFIGNGPLCPVDDDHCDSDYSKYNAIVALSGQVPVKVSAAGGVIQVGDPIGFSAVPGIGQKVSVGAIVGYAQQPASADGTIKVLIRPGTVGGDPAADLQARDVSAATLQTSGDLTIGGNAAIAGSATIAGSLNVGGLGDFGSLNIRGSATFGADVTVKGSVSIEGSLTVAGPTSVQDITINGHIITAGTAPTFDLLPAAGSSNATATINGNDTSGTITITVGAAGSAPGQTPAITGPAIGDLLKLHFNKSYTKAPRIMINGNDAGSAKLTVFPTSAAVDAFNLSIADPPQPGTTYSFTYYIVE